MLTPAMTLAFILATICGALFHLIVGGDIRQLALYLISAWAGFALGQLIGGLLQLEVMRIGVLQVLPAVLGALGMLLAARLLLVRVDQRR
jgi:hypothetical protein